jgi:hypothetical protein
MRCGISGCKDEVSFESSTAHYAQFHQRFSCSKCREAFIGTEALANHDSSACIPKGNPSKVIEAKRKVSKPSKRTSMILDWLERMSKAELDPASTYSSLDVSTTSEVCKKKVRYQNTDDAILALIRMEKSMGGLIEQLPYRCNHCRGVHNTHLISLRRLSDLISKYEERQNH